ncbi:MAG: sorbosone dehydrogenase, partial [Candidatus Magasanikiibacteriota bacterium]
DLPAHSAPLGLTFVPNNSKWPSEYKNNLFVAFHGSWNRSTPTGYKVVRIILDEKNNFVRQEDFISGWLTGKGALGRPVDLVFGLDGALYISDDKAGVIYRIEYQM